MQPLILGTMWFIFAIIILTMSEQEPDFRFYNALIIANVWIATHYITTKL